MVPIYISYFILINIILLQLRVLTDFILYTITSSVYEIDNILETLILFNSP